MFCNYNNTFIALHSSDPYQIKVMGKASAIIKLRQLSLKAYLPEYIERGTDTFGYRTLCMYVWIQVMGTSTVQLDVQSGSGAKGHGFNA